MTLKAALVRVFSIGGMKECSFILYVILSLSHVLSYLIFYNIHHWSSKTALVAPLDANGGALVDLIVCCGVWLGGAGARCTH